MGVIGTIAGQLDKLLIFHFIGTVELAIYSIAIAPIEQIKATFKGVATLVLPKYSTQSASQIHKGLWVKMFYTGGLLLVIALIYIVSAPYLFALAFPKYQTSVLLSQIFSLSLVTSMAIFPASALQALQAKKELYKLSISVAVLQITFLAIGVYFFGILGVVFARIITKVFESSLTTILFKSITKK